MEISTRHDGRSVHLLAYLPDPTHEPLVEALRKVLDGRNARVPAIVQRLNAANIAITEDEVHDLAGGPAATGRPHVADVLVRRGVVASRDQAFAEYLSPGRPGYVDRYAAPLEEMIGIVADAGGVTVIAHPWGRGARSGMDEEQLARLAAVGLSGIEVDHQDHDGAARKALRAIARNLGLVQTGSSDHHGTGKFNHDLGCNTTDPAEYERLVDLATAAAAASGRDAPTVLVP
jgi:hypothetical protein